LPRLAYGIAIATAAADFLVVKFLMGSGATGKVLISGLADFRPIFNRGVSFGLLAPDGPAGRHLLIALLVSISLFVAVMAWRASTRLSSIGFGLILGGALGNLVNRLINGGVFDFLALHLGRMPLFVCNFADVVITAGVVVLFAESLFAKQGATDNWDVAQ
jgi:signal peptidase II